jgi:hypothetical protein
MFNVLMLLYIFGSPLLQGMETESAALNKSEIQQSLCSQLITKIEATESEDALASLYTTISFITISCIQHISWDQLDSTVQDLPLYTGPTLIEDPSKKKGVRSAWVKAFFEISNLWLEKTPVEFKHLEYFILFDDDLGCLKARDVYAKIKQNNQAAGGVVNLEQKKEILINHCTVLSNIPMPYKTISTWNCFF